jgi:hypothetical protein
MFHPCSLWHKALRGSTLQAYSGDTESAGDTKRTQHELTVFVNCVDYSGPQVVDEDHYPFLVKIHVWVG